MKETKELESKRMIKPLTLSERLRLRAEFNITILKEAFLRPNEDSDIIIDYGSKKVYVLRGRKN